MKVIMLEYFSPNSIYTLELCHKLSELCDVTLICKDNYKPDNEIPFKVKNVLHSSSQNLFYSLKGYLTDLYKIAYIIKMEKPDIFHIQGIVHQEFEIWLLRYIKPYVGKLCFTAHNILSHEEKKNEKRKLDKWYAQFDGIIVHNNESKRLLLEASSYRGNLCVIPHGVYDSYSSNVTIRENEHRKVTFLQFGIIRDYKGVDILIEAVAKLPVEVRNCVKVIIAGKKNNQQYSYDIQKHVMELGIADCVELMLRRIEDEELPELFNKSDCCLFPYRMIYGSGALLMAYTFEKPVIVSDIAVFIEESDYGKTGLMFESQNPESLKDAIVRFVNLDTECLQSMKRNIIYLREKKYNWRISSKKTSEYYEMLLNK